MKSAVIETEVCDHCTERFDARGAIITASGVVCEGCFEDEIREVENHRNGGL